MVNPLSDLKNNEQERLTAELKKHKPDTSFSLVFAARLRDRLRQKAAAYAQSNTGPISNNLKNYMHMKKFILSFGTLAFVALAALIVYPIIQKQYSPGVVSQHLLSGSFSVTPVRENSFGNLQTNTMRQQNSAAGLGGGGNAVVLYAPNEPDPTMDTKISDNSERMMMPQQTYTYVYKGEALIGLADKQSVLRRLGNSGNQSAAGDLVKKFSLGLVDIGKFQQQKLQNFTMVEDREFGYSISVDLNQSIVSISQNWEKWPHPEQSCQTDSCYQQYRIKISELPDDGTAISIANEFLANFGISNQGYGSPSVNNFWRTDYERSTDKANYYIPDSITVIYPLVFDGQQVLDEGGNPSGISVSVDSKTKRVTGVYGLHSQQYESSEYLGETSSEKILQIAQAGGFRSYLPLATERTKGIEVELGTPVSGFVQIWKYDQGQTQELYVPALVFPVKGVVQDGTYLPKQVIVPLVKELLDDSLFPIRAQGGVMFK